MRFGILSHGRSVSRRRTARYALAAFAAVAVAVGPGAVPAQAAGPPRVDLRVLVVTDGTPWVEAIREQLTSEGVPTTVVNLGDASRPAITGGYLADSLDDGTPHGRFQGVVLPSDAPPGLAAAERDALADYQATFSVRQVDAYVYPHAGVGLNAPSYAGTLDGATVTATSAAKTAGFGYLDGTFTFEDADPNLAESYAYLAQPLPATPTATFTPFLTAPIPGAGTQATLAGVFRSGGREQLVIGFGYNYFQLQYRHVAHGIVGWLTKGVRLGYWRNYLTAHIDDVFAADARWSVAGKCTPPDDSTCPPGTPDTEPIRMTPNDVLYAYAWQERNDFTMDMLFNGGASADFEQGGTDPLLSTFRALRGQFRWVNHTYTHPFLGCVQDHTVVPWRCQTDANGNTVWVDSATVNGQIADNIAWARRYRFALRPGELVAGEHSGTRILPQQPADNPNFTAALGPNGIRWLGLDASREPAMRPVGAALGLPRYPVNVFYNVATEREEVSEYNWLYTSRADGGSGICETNPATTCIEPLDLDTGWESYILPQTVRMTLGFATRNDPRPVYMHQSNLAGDRLAYPVIGGVLAAYRGVYAANTPVVNGTMTAASRAMHTQHQWAQRQDQVHGYVQGGTVTVTGPADAQVPITAPAGTRVGSAAFGAAYGGERSAYHTLGAAATTLTLPSTPYPGAEGDPAAGATTSPAPAQRTTSTRAINDPVPPADRVVVPGARDEVVVPEAREEMREPRVRR